MKFTLERTRANTIHRYTNNSIVVGDQEFRQSIILGADFIIEQWQHPALDAFEVATLELALEKQPELIVLGTGAVHRFPPPTLLGNLAALGIGLEIMSTAAASRTYNVLAQEDRVVIGAMMIEPKP